MSRSVWGGMALAGAMVLAFVSVATLSKNRRVCKARRVMRRAEKKAEGVMSAIMHAMF